MGFLDKAKAQAESLAAKAQDGISQGQAKISAASANSAAKGLFEQLGAWQWAVKQGRDDGQGQAQIERIFAELAAHEEAHGEIAIPSVPAPPAPPQDASAPPETAPVQAEVPPPPPGADVPPPPPGFDTSPPPQG